ncbi:MAG: hypothetical protein V4607_02015 [Pseudomonadota bacterium]
MAIDDLLYQSDSAQRKARTGVRPAIDAQTQQRLAQMRTADSVAAEQSLAQQRAAAPSAANTARPATPPKVGALNKATRISRVGGGIAAGVIPAAAIGSSIDAFSRPTEDYYNRLGLDPKTVGENGFKDVAARTAGVVSDVGAGVLDIGTGAVNVARGFGGAEPIQSFGSILRANDNPAQQGIAAPLPNPASIARPTNLPNDPRAVSAQDDAPGADGASSGVYRNGNTFSDQPIAGGVEFNAAKKGGGVSVIGNEQDLKRTQDFVNQSQQQSLDARARQSVDLAASTSSENQIAQRNALNDSARNARISAGSVGLVKGGRTQRQLLAAATDFEGRAADAAGRAPNKDFIRTPEQEQELRLNDQQAKTQNALGGEQAIAQGLQNKNAQRQQSIIDQLSDQNLGSDARRVLERQALIGLGKDPREASLQRVRSVAGTDSFGQPIMADSLYDSENKKWLTPPSGAAQPAMGSGGQEAPTLDKFLAAAKADPRNKGQSDDQLKAYYQRTYGQ